MKSYTFYIFFFVFSLILNPLNQDQQEKFLSSNLYEAMHSGFLQSQSKIILTDKIIISCKFKSMNRSPSKSLKQKNKFTKSKI